MPILFTVNTRGVYGDIASHPLDATMSVTLANDLSIALAGDQSVWVSDPLVITATITNTGNVGYVDAHYTQTLDPAKIALDTSAGKVAMGGQPLTRVETLAAAGQYIYDGDTGDFEIWMSAIDPAANESTPTEVAITYAVRTRA